MALLRDRNIDPEIVEYLTTPPDARTLAKLVKQLGVDAADIIRQKEYKALGLPGTDDSDELVARMAAHPEIIQRPIVVHGAKARLGRPPENVLDII